MSLTPLLNVGKLQAGSRAKSKNALNDRFHVLYDKIDRRDVREWALSRRRINGGVPGVDGQG